MVVVFDVVVVAFVGFAVGFVVGFAVDLVTGFGACVVVVVVNFGADVAAALAAGVVGFGAGVVVVVVLVAFNFDRVGIGAVTEVEPIEAVDESATIGFLF